MATASAGALVPAVAGAVAGDLACAAFDALGDNDPYRDELGEWWSGHRSRAAALSNAALDELVKIIAPPTPKKCGIRTPSEAQTAAHEEAKGAATEAHALCQQQNAERKKELEKARPARDRSDRKRQADAGADEVRCAPPPSPLSSSSPAPRSLASRLPHAAPGITATGARIGPSRQKVSCSHVELDALPLECLIECARARPCTDADGRAVWRRPLNICVAPPAQDPLEPLCRRPCQRDGRQRVHAERRIGGHPLAGPVRRGAARPLPRL